MSLKNQLSLKKNLELFIKEWNIKFPYDRLWRQKYKIPFGSKDHLEADQIDIYLDMIEDQYIESLRLDYVSRKERKAEYLKTGIILKEEKMSQEEEDKIYNKLKFPEPNV